MKENINKSENFKHFSYPSIKVFNNLVNNIKHKTRFIGLDEETNTPMYDSLKPLPVLKVMGTTKIHGTNASIVFDFKNNVIYYQSRENIISPFSDNAKFAFNMSQKQTLIYDMVMEKLSHINISGYDKVVIFGEWCGGSIQKGQDLGIAKLDKRFIIFDVRLIKTENIINDEAQSYSYKWLDRNLVSLFKDETLGIYNIYEFPTYELEIDFNRAAMYVDVINDLTLEIENSCPVTKYFGKEGVGEGIVFKVITDDDNFNDSGFWFKSKGEKHAGKSKVKVIKDVDSELQKKKLLVADKVTPEWRLEQALEKEVDFMNGGILDRKHIGGFIRNVINDIKKEEMDYLLEQDLSITEIGGAVSNIAKTYFFNVEQKLLEE